MKDGDVVTGAEETTELATEEEPLEEVAKESNMVMALLLVGGPKSRSIETRRKTSLKKSCQVHEKPVTLIFLGKLPPRGMEPIRIPRYNTRACGIPTHAHLC